MSSNENFALGSVVITALAFAFYFFQVTQNGVLIEMEPAVIGWPLVKIFAVVIVAAIALAIAIWSRPKAIEPGVINEREHSNEAKAIKNAYRTLNGLITILVILIFTDQAYGWMASYSPANIEGLVFLLVASLSLAEIVHFGFIVIYGRR